MKNSKQQHSGHGKEEIRDARKRKASVEIDMNPMVDLAFLLLTFFMLTTTFTLPQAMEIVMPSKAEKSDQEQAVKESKTITLLLGSENRLFYYQGISEPELKETDYSRNGLRSLLLEKKKDVDGLIILIKPRESSSYKNFVDVLDEMSINDIERYAVVDFSDFDLDLIKNYEGG